MHVAFLADGVVPGAASASCRSCELAARRGEQQKAGDDSRGEFAEFRGLSRQPDGHGGAARYPKSSKRSRSPGRPIRSSRITPATSMWITAGFMKRSRPPAARRRSTRCARCYSKCGHPPSGSCPEPPRIAPKWFVDISATLDRSCAALDAYSWNFATGRIRVRGAASSIWLAGAGPPLAWMLPKRSS